MTEFLLPIACLGAMLEIQIARAYQLTHEPRLALIGVFLGAAILGGLAASLREVWK